MSVPAAPQRSSRPGIGHQPELFGRSETYGAPDAPADLSSYDRYVVAFSGGKDSTACVLRLLESEGVGAEDVELWHHDVDGSSTDDNPGAEDYAAHGDSAGGLMDWPCTPGYCRAFAEALGLDLYFSWKTGGFEREMLRDGDRTAPIRYETPGQGVQARGGTGGKKSTRRRFPQVSADLGVRWCSSYLKVMVADTALRGQERFQSPPEEETPRTLVLTGERGEESAARSGYSGFEPHRADLRGGTKYQRHIDHWRPVLRWTEEDVWAVIQRWGINTHPSYSLGLGRTSCCACIFGSANQFATLRFVAPERFEKVARYEEEFEGTIKRSGLSIRDLADRGRVYPAAVGEGGGLSGAARQATSAGFDAPVLLSPEAWALPAGAFGEIGCGPR